MGRPRKRHVQVEIEFHRRGGRRRRAGRRPASGRRRVSHARRPELCARHPTHITLRVLDDVGRLRRRDAFKVVRAAMLQQQMRRDFRIVHLSIQSNHLHLICEADHRLALARGIQGFKISTAKKLNRIRNRAGNVFADRYHEEVLTTPTHVRNCVAYVVNNWRRHREDRGASTVVDPFSTGMWFEGWREARFDVRDESQWLPRVAPKSWLLAEGWKKVRSISWYEVPGPR